MNSHPRILVTSALPYANGAIHFGHLAGAYLPADMFVRYHRLKGSDILYICGSDEHGVSILISANKEQVDPRVIIDRYHTVNKDAFDRMGIRFDNYSRTSLSLHHATAQEFFRDFHERGLLTSKEEQQLFDEDAGMFLPDRFVVGICPHCGYDRAYGDQCENCSTYYQQTELLNPVSLLSGKTPVIRNARHWYFPLGDYQQRLEEYVTAHEKEWKDNVVQQVRSWLTSGLSDRPISRDLNWGIPVPVEEGEGKVLYVWFEAVLGYISASKEWAASRGTPDAWKDYWCDPETRYIAFIGKDNIVFHCLMFPAMLMAKGGYVLPENVPANEFLNLEGKKFSKSQGWSIEIADFLERFPADPLRYTLALSMPEAKDTDFYWRDFQARNNNELADILGNFVHRTLTFAWKHFDGKVPTPGPTDEIDSAFMDAFATACVDIGQSYERYRFRDAALMTMNVARSCNKYFNDREPWKSVKTDLSRCATTLHHCIQAIYRLSILIEPVLPFTSGALRTILCRSDEAPWSWNEAAKGLLPIGHGLGTPTVLFPKIEDEAIEAEIAKLRKPEPVKEDEHNYPAFKEQVSLQDFQKLDFRVAMVIAAERIPKSDKLLKLQVDLGCEQRQIVAGIGKGYAPEDLLGQYIVVVANLAPAKVFGVESQGMLLAASLEDRLPVILGPGKAVVTGSIVK